MNLLSIISVSDHLGPFLAHSIKVSLLLALVAAIVYVMRQAPASIRSFVLGLALISVAILPLSSSLLPQWAVLSAPVAHYLGPGQRTISDVGESMSSSEPASASSSALPASLASESPPVSWRGVAAIVYFVGVAICIMRLAVALYRVSRLRRSAYPLPYPHQHIAAIAAAEQAGLRHEVAVRLSDAVAIPITCGWFRPAILLPSDAPEWSSDKLKAVLLHEMAHIKRRDNLTAIAMHLAIIWQWFNPLPWLVLKQYHHARNSH